tara:strand:- start:440 stop:826 length:387 start_codon:yes stop_codon:yes gene_type:complete
MRKITLSIAAIAISISSYGQTKKLDSCCVKTAQQVYEYEGLVVGSNRVLFNESEIIEIINTLDDILEWQQQDMEDGETNMGKHSEGWGSNYWLTELRNQLYQKLIESLDFESPEFREKTYKITEIKRK